MFHLSGEQPAKLIPFYKDVFGWQFAETEAPNPTWHIVTGNPGDPGVNGMLHTRERDSAVVNTIEVDDISDVIASIETRGGRILDRRTIPMAGEIALFEDPAHNVFQLRQPPNEGG